MITGKLDDLVEQMKNNHQNIKLVDLCKVCENYFGKARQVKSSHRIYKTPWQGDPRINIQNHKGKAKAYQVKQVLLALEKLEVGRGAKK